MKNKAKSDKELILTLKSLGKDEKANPSEIFRVNAKIRILNQIKEEIPAPKKTGIFSFLRAVFVIRAALIVFLLFIFLSTGTILAAQNAKPKDRLYPLKLASEKALLNVSPLLSWKSDIAVGIVKRRGSEVHLEDLEAEESEVRQEISRYKESIDEAKKFGNDSRLKNEEKKLEDLLSKLDEKDDNEENEGIEVLKAINIETEQKQEETIQPPPSPTLQPADEESVTVEIKAKEDEQSRTEQSGNEPSSGYIDKAIEDVRNTTEDSLNFLF